MSEPSCAIILLVLVCIFAYFDKSGRHGFKRKKRYLLPKTLSSMKRALSNEYEASSYAFEQSIHHGITWPGGYHMYLRSPEWKVKRDLVVIRDGHQCQDCLSVEFLEVHHLNYFFIYREEENDYKDLVTLCSDCHQTRHDEDEELFTYKC